MMVEGYIYTRTMKLALTQSLSLGGVRFFIYLYNIESRVVESGVLESAAILVKCRRPQQNFVSGLTLEARRGVLQR